MPAILIEIYTQLVDFRHLKYMMVGDKSFSKASEHLTCPVKKQQT